MILAIDIGNTNIVVGCIDDKKTYFIERLSTVRTKTELEYAVDLKTVLDIYHIKKTDIEGCIISSVVPQITNIAKLAAEKILKKEVMVLGPGVKTGLNIMMDNPGQLGADLVANAVAGLNEYPVPFIVIDMGTATTVSVVNSKKQYIGGMIMPGIGKNLHIDYGISVYVGSVHPKDPDTFVKFLRIPEEVCNAEEDPVLSQKAMLLFRENPEIRK